MTEDAGVVLATKTAKQASTTRTSACLLMAFSAKQAQEKGWLFRQVQAEISAFRKHLAFPKEREDEHLHKVLMAAVNGVLEEMM